MKDRTAANAMDSNAVDQVGFFGRLPGAHGAREEAQRGRLYGGVSQPANVAADTARLVHWQKCYGALWQLKLAFEKQHNR